MNLQQPQQPNLQPIRLPPPVVLPQNPNPIRNLNFRNLPNQNQNPGIFNRQNPNDGKRKSRKSLRKSRRKSRKSLRKSRRKSRKSRKFTRHFRYL